MENFKGKAIYCPSGKAAEYSKWAVNFYNGCSAKCEYCYNRHGITAKVLGGDKPTLKKSLVCEDDAIDIFEIELHQNLQDLHEHGLFFNFVSDPCLTETYNLNRSAWMLCLFNDIPVKVLTKQTWWLENFLKDVETWLDLIPVLWNRRHLIVFGFTLTGHDELEPGAAPNMDRIRAMKVLSDEGFKTFASIEPIIDIEGSLRMIGEICNHVDLVKIGLQSGKSYFSADLVEMVFRVDRMAETYGFKVYFKDSLVKQLMMDRAKLPDYCVDRDYRIWE